jgi:hypothetical protein
MAEIPVEKKHGMPGWLIPLLVGLAILAIILFFVLGNDDDDIERADIETTDTDRYALAAVAVDDVTDDREGLMMGNEVELTNVRVGEVVNDEGFYVSDGNERIFVALDEVPTPQTPGTEGRYDINEGMMINLTGRLRTADATPAGSTIRLPQGTDVYFYAQRAEVLSRS